MVSIKRSSYNSVILFLDAYRTVAKRLVHHAGEKRVNGPSPSLLQRTAVPE